MEIAYATLTGALFASGMYMMRRESEVHVLVGIALLGYGANLFMFVAGGLTREAPPIIPSDQAVLGPGAADPLPQAMVLTAVVIGFAVFAFAGALLVRRAQAEGRAQE